MEGKNLYVSNLVRLSKRGKIVEVVETEKDYIFKLEGKNKEYIFNKDIWKIYKKTNEAITMIKK